MHAPSHALCIPRPLSAMKAWSNVKEEKDAIPQVILTTKNSTIFIAVWFQWTVPRWARMGSICHSYVVSTTQFARDKLWWFKYRLSSQHDVSATWKLSEKIDPEGMNSTYTTNYPMQYSWNLRVMLGSRKTKGWCWNIFWNVHTNNTIIVTQWKTRSTKQLIQKYMHTLKHWCVVWTSCS